MSGWTTPWRSDLHPARNLPGNAQPTAAANQVYRSCVNIDTTYEGIKERDLGKIYAAFANQPLCNTLTMEQSEALFREMCRNTRAYIDPYFDLGQYFQG